MFVKGHFDLKNMFLIITQENTHWFHIAIADKTHCRQNDEVVVFNMQKVKGQLKCSKFMVIVDLCYHVKDICEVFVFHNS